MITGSISSSKQTIEMASSVNPAKFVGERREKLYRSFNRRFDQLEQDLSYKQIIDEENLKRLHTICNDPDFSFSLPGKNDKRTPLARILTLTTIDPNLSFGFTQFPWLVESVYVDVCSDAVVRNWFGMLSAQDTINQIVRANDYLDKKELNPGKAVQYSSSATQIAMDLLRIAVNKIENINVVLLDPNHLYLSEIYNTEVIDFLIDNGLIALDSQYNYKKNGAYASKDGLKYLARLIIAETVLSYKEKSERIMVERALLEQIKPFFAKCIERNDQFQVDNGFEPMDIVHELFFEHMAVLTDDSMLELMKIAQQKGYFRREKIESRELMDTICEGFNCHVNDSYYYDIPLPIKTFEYLVLNGVKFNATHIELLDDVDKQLDEKLSELVGDSVSDWRRDFLLAQKKRLAFLKSLAA